MPALFLRLMGGVRKGGSADAPLLCLAEGNPDGEEGQRNLHAFLAELEARFGFQPDFARNPDVIPGDVHPDIALRRCQRTADFRAEVAIFVADEPFRGEQLAGNARRTAELLIADDRAFQFALYGVDFAIRARESAIFGGAETDTDFTAKLVDVAPGPDGKEIPYGITDGILRARFRESDKQTSLIEPGKVYEYTIEMGNTSIAFLPGHRIRLEVSSSNFPRFDRNPNTGHAFGADADLVSATQTIFHSSQYASHLLLPILKQ